MSTTPGTAGAADTVAPPHLPTEAGAGTTRTRRRVPSPLRHLLAQQATAHGCALETVLLCAFHEVLTAWSQNDDFGITLRRVGPHAPHRSGLPAAATVTTITGVSEFAAPFADRAAGTEARLTAAARRRIPADQPVPAAGCLLTVRTAHTASTRPPPSGRIDCTVTVRSGELGVDWDAAGLPAGMLDDIADAYQELLCDLAADSGTWRSTHRDPLPARQRRTRARVNDTAGPVPGTLLHEPFDRQARATPDAPAVITDRRTVTYAELQTAARAVAARLHRLGAGPNRLVAVVADKGWEQVAAVLGVHTAGAAYVPIAPDLPIRRVHDLIGHAQAEIVLTGAQLAADPDWPAGVTVVTVTDDLLTAPVVPPPPIGTRPDDLAYVIYTSGSTGEPKGVMISHRAAGNTVADINRRHRITVHDRVLALASLSFDLSVYDIFGPLSAGGAVVMPAPGTSRAPWSWLEALTTHHVTVWNSVPALLQMLALYTEARGERLPDTLRLILMSGDWIPTTLPDRIRALGVPDVDIIGMGGATEAAIWSNDYRITAVDPSWPSIPYGTPLTNQTFEVLDPHLRRRPDRIAGELYIGGLGVALGYWRDPVRTAASFITHPRTGHRLYRTGDLGRYLTDGNLEFLGRNDHQVKIQGFRVELGEIETALLAHPHVGAAAVTATGSPADGERRLVAYVVPTADFPANGTDLLREHLGSRLPGYMVPGEILTRDALPLTTNGKVDRSALPHRP